MVEEVAETAQDDAPTCVPGDDQPLTVGQELFVRCVVDGLSMDECVAKTGRCLRTLQYWKSQPEVARAISGAFQAGLAQARAVLTKNAAKAASTLVDLAADAEDPDSARARTAAAKAVLDTAIKLGEHFGDSAPSRHEISGTAPISLRIVDPAATEPEQEYAGDPTGDAGPGEHP